VSARAIPQPHRVGELEDGALPRGGDHLLDIGHRDGGALAREDRQPLDRVGELAELGAHLVAQELRRRRVGEAHAAQLGLVAHEPRQLVLVQRVELDQHPGLLERGEELEPLVGLVTDEHQAGLLARLGDVGHQLRQLVGLHLVGVAHHHQPPLGHHRQRARGRGDPAGGGLLALEQLVVEVAGARIEHALAQQLDRAVDQEALLAVDEVQRAGLALAQRRQRIAVLARRCHRGAM